MDRKKRDIFLATLYNAAQPNPTQLYPRSQPQVLHLTDIHLDLEYQIGTNADCDLPVCCISLAGPARVH